MIGALQSVPMVCEERTGRGMTCASVTNDGSHYRSGLALTNIGAMNEEYEPYIIADSSFYDAMHSEQTAGVSFAAANRPLPAGWTRYEQDDWFVFSPGTSGLPAQGWKLHASATNTNAWHRWPTGLPGDIRS